jgi:hypothetical protein
MHTHAQRLLLLLLLLLLRLQHSQVMQSSNEYGKLGERLGLADHQAVLTSPNPRKTLLLEVLRLYFATHT